MKLIIIGSTGSIGKQTLDILDTSFEVSIVFNKNTNLGYEQIKKYNIKHFYSPNESVCSKFKSFEEMIDYIKPDMILNAVPGFEGLNYSFITINKKIDLFLANKESLTIAGKFLTELAYKNKVKIIPIDSEHTALYKLIKDNPNNIKKLYITCSGSVIYNKNESQIKELKPSDIFLHPNWKMGKKILVDSASLMNKVFELVEAHWLFRKDIEAIFHPQSLVHALVEYNDNSFYCQISKPDMKLSINLAFNNFLIPNNSQINELDFDNLKFDFKKIDLKKYPQILFAKRIIEDKNNSLGLIINTANEIAIDLFLKEKINILDFYDFISKFIVKYKDLKINKISDIFEIKEKIEKEYKNEQNY